MRELDLIQGSDEWRAYRRRGVGGSDIPVIMGISPYKTPKQLLYEKVHGEKPISEWTQRIFDRGHQVEEMVRAGFETPFRPAVFEYERGIFASLDGIHGDEVLEVKSTESESVISAIDQGRIPDNYLYQLNWNMGVSGVTSGLLVIENHGNLRSFAVKFDELLFERCLRQAREFLFLINKSVKADLERQFVELDDQAEKLAKELENIRERQRGITKELESLHEIEGQ